MAFTYSEQIRQVRVPLAAPLYEIFMEITDKGDLTDGAVFVMTVTDSTDPKSDTLARVATVADLEMLGIDRAAVVAATPLIDGEGNNNVLLYRSAQITLQYDSLATAVAAKDVLKSRVDEIVLDWQTYRGQFLADGLVHSGVLYPIDITEHPRYNQDAYTLLLKAYLGAVANEATAQTALNTALSSYTAAQAAAAAAQDEVNESQTVLTGCNQMRDKVTTFKNAATTYRGSSTADPAVTAAFDAALVVFNTPPTCDSFCAAQQAVYNAAVTAKATADAAVATARTAYESAKAAYTYAQNVTNAALAAIRTLKPTFDPATDIPAGLTA